jgi:lipopolysaccharide/colanic/teichoic acid biosynthesis glycosyltransferase
MKQRAGRACEMVLAALLLACAAPVLFVAMLAIRAEGGGPALYLAPRIGRHGRVFAMVKLRTMVAGADRLGGRLAPEGDPRITRIGRWLRRWKIDELPQFWNVLRGDMALVGPRPDTLCGADDYAAAELRLLAVRPGITCFASILFFDEGRALAGMADPLAHYHAVTRPLKVRLGLAWLAQRSWTGDLAILALTAAAFVARGAAQRGVATLLRRQGADAELLALLPPDAQLASRSTSAAAARG